MRQMDEAQSFFTVFLIKLIIGGALFSTWLVWFCYKIVSVIDRNVALTEPETSWIDFIKYKINLRRYPDVIFDEVDRPKFKIGFIPYTLIMLFIFLMMSRCW